VVDTEEEYSLKCLRGRVALHDQLECPYQEKTMSENSEGSIKQDVTAHVIDGELSRTYTYTLFGVSKNISIKIDKPKVLYCGVGHAFHRVWDGVEVHLCHAPGPIRDIDLNIVGLCKITWEPSTPDAPVRF
jgi:hypothetical protein